MPKRNGIFQHVVREKVPQTTFNLSYSNKGTMDAGKLYPVFYKPTIPGDVFYGGTSAFLRTQPMVNPLLANINLEMRYFWVPYRQIWKNWTNYLTDQDPSKVYDGTNPFTGHFPRMSWQYDETLDEPSQWGMALCAKGKLGDWLGVPEKWLGSMGNGESVPLNALPWRAYWYIWNEYFRDENLQDPINFHFDDTNEIVDCDAKAELLRVCWKKDRFTSALPFPQKGDDVQLDNIVRLLSPSERGQTLGNHNSQVVGRWMTDPDTGKQVFDPIRGSSGSPTKPAGAGLEAYYGSNDPGKGNLTTPSPLDYAAYTSGNSSLEARIVDGGVYGPYYNLDIDPNGTLSAQLSVRRLRQASAIQRILEKKALAGSRYAEYILGMYGVRIPDAEIGRPVYLGGGSNPINITPVEQMSASVSGQTPQGTLAGKGVGVGGFHLNRPWLFNDFGYIMGVAYIRPEAEYYQGLKRDLWMNEREDYYNPDYQLLGEEEIACGEVCLCEDQNPYDTFGYQDRYAYLKSSENEIHGELKSTMISWVQPRIFDNTSDQIALNGAFMECDPYEANNFAVDGYPHYIVEFYNGFNARRPMYYVPLLKNGQL